jgi:predicted nucleic acid-binding protein
MRVVSNTSPICNLAIIGRLELLRERYGRIEIPPAVARELAALIHAKGAQAIGMALAHGWLAVTPLTEKSSPNLQARLDPGESEAIALALQVQADVLLIDEKHGRAAARQFRLTVAGVLGELVHAKLHRRIPKVRDELSRLKRDAGFFVDAGVERFILGQVGE